MSLAFLDLLALALAWTRLVAHIRGAGEAFLTAPKALLDEGEGLLESLFVDGGGRSNLPKSVPSSSASERERTSRSRLTISVSPNPGPRSLTIKAISLRSFVSRSAICASSRASGVRVYNGRRVVS